MLLSFFNCQFYAVRTVTILFECYSYEWTIATSNFSATLTQMWLWQYTSHTTTSKCLYISNSTFTRIWPLKVKSSPWAIAANRKTKAPITPPTGRISAQLLISTQQPSQWRNQTFCTPFMFGVRFNYCSVHLERFIYFQEHNKCQPVLVVATYCTIPCYCTSTVPPKYYKCVHC